jgi:hypothetical protein
MSTYSSSAAIAVAVAPPMPLNACLAGQLAYIIVKTINTIQWSREAHLSKFCKLFLEGAIEQSTVWEDMRRTECPEMSFHGLEVRSRKVS